VSNLAIVEFHSAIARMSQSFLKAHAFAREDARSERCPVVCGTGESCPLDDGIDSAGSRGMRLTAVRNHNTIIL